IKRTSATYPNGVSESRTYDTLKRLTNLVYTSDTGTLLWVRYGFDNGDRRTGEIWNNGRNVSYGYDRAYQLLSGASTARPSDNAFYLYDKAGNPLRRTEMGLTADYTFNGLNQFTSGTWTGKLTVAGEANYAAGTVTVNGVVGQLFSDRSFEASNVTVSVGSNLLTAIYTGPAFTNTAMTATSKVSVTVGNPVFGYDANGNLTNDAEFTYFYDLANRLTNAVNKSTGLSVLSARYDGLGRRVEVTRNGTNVERYVYLPGSFLVLAVLDGSSQIKEVWSRGPDQSGGLDGAGGIGGILSVSTNIGTAVASKYFHADAVGNVLLVTSSGGQQIAQYRFSPFGKLVGQVGDYQPRFAFSSKEVDPQTGLILYGLRYLSPACGSWLSRDPAGEADDANLYSFVRREPLTSVDSWGLQTRVRGAAETQVNRDYDLLRNSEAYLRAADTRFRQNIARAPGAPEGLQNEVQRALRDLETPVLRQGGNRFRLYGIRARANIETAQRLDELSNMLGLYCAPVSGGKPTACPTRAELEQRLEAIADTGLREAMRRSLLGTPETTALSPYRRTRAGEAYPRFESSKVPSRITSEGGVLPETFAGGSARDSSLTSPEAIAGYNLPRPDLARDIRFDLNPPEGTWIIGPRPVQGGPLSEVLFPLGAPPGTASGPYPVTCPP
ncbi:MAG: RHS repeat-associated core domain-containing protein, partial [Phycisphaerae bacterium]|nr:RHS repeat-associated core domain-containing protein [Phycisphaerae bacterium]